MHATQRRFVMAALLLGSTALLAHWLHQPQGAPAPHRRQVAGVIPLQIGEYRGKDADVAESVVAYLQAEEVLARAYVGPDDETVHLAAAFGRDWRSAHSPRSCLQMMGYSLDVQHGRRLELPPEHAHLPPLNVLLLSAHRQGAPRIISAFTFVTPRQTTPNQALHAWDMVTRGRSTGALLLMVSAEVPDANERHAERVCRFLRLVYPYATSLWVE